MILRTTDERFIAHPAALMINKDGKPITKIIPTKEIVQLLDIVRDEDGKPIKPEFDILGKLLNGDVAAGGLCFVFGEPSKQLCDKALAPGPPKPKSNKRFKGVQRVGEEIEDGNVPIKEKSAKDIGKSLEKDLEALLGVKPKTKKKSSKKKKKTRKKPK